MAQLTVELINRLGLHARAAAKFVHTTSRFSAQVLVRHNDEEVNGKSILGLSIEDNELAEQALKHHQFTVLRQADISR